MHAKHGSGYGYSGVRADRHGHHRRRCTGDHRPAAQQRVLWPPTRAARIVGDTVVHRETAAQPPNAFYRSLPLPTELLLHTASYLLIHTTPAVPLSNSSTTAFYGRWHNCTASSVTRRWHTGSCSCARLPAQIWSRLSVRLPEAQRAYRRLAQQMADTGILVAQFGWARSAAQTTTQARSS